MTPEAHQAPSTIASSSAPRLYTIPPSAPFLESLARAILHGDLPCLGGDAPSPLDLPRMTIYLPTRRSARALGEAFLKASDGRALLLPRIRTLGDPDEEALLFGASGETDQAAGLPAISPLQRRLALIPLILAWQQRMGKHEALRKDLTEAVGARPITPGQASSLAADLARFMDFIETEGADLSRLSELAPESLAEHWQLTINFLEIVTEHWPAYLADNGLISPAARRIALMDQEAQMLAQGSEQGLEQSAGPVIAAGSTGSVPATARLLKTIASLPQGAVVLPGLDLDLDDESWAALASHPEHPQFGMAELLRRLDATRKDVSVLAGTAPDEQQAARLSPMREVLRPAETTDRWQQLLQTPQPYGEAAIAGLRLIEAANPQDEAEAIAFILRSVVETPGKTAALVTPDRGLARRVAARMRQFGIAIDDSAGLAISRTVPGAFLDLVLDAVTSDFAPVPLMALLKHPLTRLGRSAGAIRELARSLERASFREVYLGTGLEGIATSLDAQSEAVRSRDGASAKGAKDVAAATDLVAGLRRAFAPLLDIRKDIGSATAAALAEAHSAVAEALATDEAGSTDRLWQGEAGEALSLFFAELMACGGSLPLRFGDYPPLYRSLLAGQVVRPRRGALPQLAIWGPLEARLQQPDLVILGGLNEGVWPRAQEAGPWLNRSMQAQLDLPPPERRIGLSAHDFAQSLGARDVYLTRSMKVDGVKTVPSRWLQRLVALTDALELKAALEPKRPWLAWAALRDRVDGFSPVAAPAPCPPVAARPRQLSVSRIQHWIANPYGIFARDILKLRPLAPLGQAPGIRERGEIVHDALAAFATDYPDHLPDDIAAVLIDLAEAGFARFGGAAQVEALWRPYFANFAAWFAATEPGRRAGMVRILSEVPGTLGLATQDFTLTARADRIDLDRNGRLVLYDYKTGSVPAPGQVEKQFAPQLPLEATMAMGGGFDGVAASPVDGLFYIGAAGHRGGGTQTKAGSSAPDHLARAALEALERLVAAYDNPKQAYAALRRPDRPFSNAYRYDDYAQLARVAEWGSAGDDGDGQ